MSDSVESHGSARSSGSNKSQKQASRLWLDKGSFWEGLDPVDLQDGSTRLLEQISWDLKVSLWCPLRYAQHSSQAYKESCAPGAFHLEGWMSPSMSANRQYFGKTNTPQAALAGGC